MVWSEILSNLVANNRETASRILIAQIQLLALIIDAPILATYHRIVIRAEETPNVSFMITFHFADVLIRPLAIRQ